MYIIYSINNMFLPYKNESKYTLGTLNPLEEFDKESDLVTALINKDINIGLPITTYIQYLECLLHRIGEQLPPIPLSDIIDSHNIKDRAFKNDLTNWINYTFDEKSLDDEANYFDSWTLIPASTYDYKVISIENNDYWYVLNEEGNPLDYDELLDLIDSYSLYVNLLTIPESKLGLLEDEDDVIELCSDLNNKCTEATYNFPFAWNTYWILPSYIPVELAQKADFLVYDDNENNIRVMGIDGGGYDFYSSHWGPLYISYCQLNKRMVDTEKGPRYI